MEILVIGMGCDKCDALYENTIMALEQLGLKADVRKVEDLVEIVRLGVMTAPSLMINGKTVISGQVAKAGKIAGLIKKEMV